MTIGGGHDITLSMEGGEQLSLEYLSPGWVEFTLFLSSLTIPGERVEGQVYRIRLARRELRRVFEKTTPPGFLS